MSALRITAVERALIFRFVLDRPQSEVSERIETLVDALRELDEAYCCARDDMSRSARDQGRHALIKARSAIAKATGSAA